MDQLLLLLLLSLLVHNVNIAIVPKHHDADDEDGDDVPTDEVHIVESDVLPPQPKRQQQQWSVDELARPAWSMNIHHHLHFHNL